MSYLDAQNVKHLLIAKDVAATVNVSIDPDSADYLAEGEIIATDREGTVLTAATAATATEIVLYQGRQGTTDGIDQISPVITKKDLIAYNTQAFVQDTETVKVVGYDGAAGSIDAINDNLYLLNVDMNESTVFGFGQDKIKHGVYKSDATATEEEIADGLTISLIANFSREPEQDILFERLVSDASVAIGAATANAVKGSEQVTITGHAVLAGSYLRFGGAATTLPVYKVASVVDANTVLLDVVYQGASNIAVNVEGIAAPAGNFGIKFSGQPREFKVGVFGFQKVRFSLQLRDFGATTTTDVSVAINGSGNWEQVSELEWGCQGNEGNYYRSRANAPVDSKRADVVVNERYILNTLSHFKSTRGHNGIGATDKSRGEVVLAYPSGAAGTSIVGANGILAVLTAFTA